MTPSSSYKPEGHPSLSLYMMADEAHRVLKFAKAVFHAELLSKQDRPDGRIRHAEFRIGDSVVMLSDGTEENPAVPVWIHVYVPDVDEAYERALAAGGVAVKVPEQAEDGERRGGISDPAGNVWWISTMMGKRDAS